MLLTQFLIQEGKVGGAKLPWQIFTYIRILTMLIFIYIINMGVILFIPDAESGKIKLFTDGLSLSSDLIKTLLGAVIGAISMSLIKDRNLDGVPDEDQQQPAQQEDHHQR